MTAAPVHLLVVDDNDDDAVLIARQLTRAGLDVTFARAETPDGMAAALADRAPDVVICDYNMPVFHAEQALEQVRAFDPDIPFLLVSGQVGEEAAAEMMRAGVRDFVLKDRLARLAPAVQRELHEAAERRRRRRTEAALRESEERLRQTERLDSLGQLAGGIAHDFNNILAIISGYADVLADELENSPCQADVQAIVQAAARGSGLTRQLLIFSRLEPSRPETLELNVVAADMQRLLARTLGEDIELSTVLADGLPPITMDRSKLEQVLMNAVMNSRAAMPNGGRLIITTSPSSEEGFVTLAITDNGCGMAPEVAARAFEPFFTTKGRGKGTGLGLATAYGVVTDVGGTITLESAVDRGTTVLVRLPVGGEAPAQPVKPARVAAASGAGRRVLVVEDEDGVRDIVCRILTKAGYEVFAAGDPQEALKLCVDGNLVVDALLSDVIMPGMSGTQLAAELRLSRPGLPVLFMSGYTSGPAPGGQEMPPDAPLLHKPFQNHQLLQAMHQLLND